MIDCEWKAYRGEFLCVHCQGRSRKQVRRNCPAKTRRPIPTQKPPLFKRLASFTVAAISHAIKGNPTCTQEEIDERLSICRGCEKFIPDKENKDLGACAECGCTTGREEKYLNKLAWADQKCPLDKWEAEKK
jgi:hypothetical protein